MAGLQSRNIVQPGKERSIRAKSFNLESPFGDRAGGTLLCVDTDISDAANVRVSAQTAPEARGNRRRSAFGYAAASPSFWFDCFGLRTRCPLLPLPAKLGPKAASHDAASLIPPL
jgi:hypothetical protein